MLDDSCFSWDLVTKLLDETCKTQYSFHNFFFNLSSACGSIFVRNDDYRDFPPEYNFAAEALARAYEKQKGSRAEVGRHSQGEEAKAPWCYCSQRSNAVP